MSIPGQIVDGVTEPAYQQPVRQTSILARTRSYKVKNSSGLWQIACNNGVDASDLRHWNGLGKYALRADQILRLQGSIQTLTARKGNAAGKHDSVTCYKVERGGSMYPIAKRSNVEMEYLQRWNPRSRQALKPGQILALYLDTVSHWQPIVGCPETPHPFLPA